MTTSRFQARTGFLALIAAGSVAAGYCAVHAPLAFLLPFAAVFGGTLVFLYPKPAAGAVVIVTLSNQALQAFVPALTFLDESAVLLFSVVVLMRCAVLQISLRRLPGTGLFAVFLLAGSISTAIGHAPIGLAFQDAFLLLKGLLFAFAAYQLRWTSDDVNSICRIGAWIISLIFVAVVLNFAVGAAWFRQLGANGAESFRGGLASPIGPFNTPGWLAQCAALASIAVMTHLVVWPHRSKYRWLLLGASLLMLLLTLRRKAIVGFLLGGAAILWLVRRTRFRTSVILLLVIPLLLFAGWDTVRSITEQTYQQYVVNTGNDSARTSLYEGGAHLASANFPFGVGLGRFGTITAFDHYSPVYYQLGFSHIYGLGPHEKFGTDTFWPAILGEAGYLGLVGYFGGLLVLFWRVLKLLRRQMSREAQFLILVAIGWWIEFMLESAAAPVYTAPPVYPLIFVAMAVALRVGEANDPDGYGR